MNDDELLRYSRHILLDDIGIEGQRRLLAAHALVIGAGGLGSPVALYLGTRRHRPAHAGRRRHRRPDQPAAPDRARPLPHRPAEGASARGRRRDQPDVDVVALHERADAARLRELVADADVVLDCSDNFATRQAVNAACVAPRAAAGRRRGDRLRRPGLGLRHAPADVALLRLPVPARRRVRGRRLLDDGRVRAAGRHRRQRAGGRGAEAARRHRHSLAGRLLMLDAREMGWTEDPRARHPDCPVCSGR